MSDKQLQSFDQSIIPETHKIEQNVMDSEDCYSSSATSIGKLMKPLIDNPHLVILLLCVLAIVLPLLILLIKYPFITLFGFYILAATFVND